MIQKIRRKYGIIISRMLIAVMLISMIAGNNVYVLAESISHANSSTEKVYVTFNQGDTELWGNSSYTKYVMNIHNNESQSICNWKITIKLPYQIEWNSGWGWCADYAVENSSLIIDPLDDGSMGSAIEAGQTYSSAGFYLPAGLTDFSDVTVEYEYGTQSTPGSSTGGSTTTGNVTLDGTTKDIAFEDTPVGKHGELSVNGIHLVDCNGENFALRGVSTHGINWFPGYIDRTGFQNLRDEWGVNAVRLAMYTTEYNGYCSGGNQTELKNLVDKGVSYATELGMYVIVDWHVLNDQNPLNNIDASKEFFREMSAKYADYDNVIYEICNEPNGGTSWSDIKSYAEVIIPIIKANNPDAVIIVGTPNWSQDVDVASTNPVTGYSNIMYAVHFYSNTHQESYRNKVAVALNNGLPVLCSEYGVCDASGNGGLNLSQANVWLDFMDSYNMSYFCWSLCNKGETASLIKTSCNKTNSYVASDLSDAGLWLVEQYRLRSGWGEEETPTEEVTEEVTEAPTEKVTEEVTEVPTEKVTEEVTEVPTEAVTETPTEEVTEATTEKATEAPTEKTTEAPTEKATEAPTEKATEAPTENPTETPTEAPTLPANAYVGDVNTELQKFSYNNDTNYLSGQIVVVEWVDTDGDGVKESTVPKYAPTMKFVSTDGTEEIEVFVTATGTNTYYFDRLLAGLTEGKEYVFQVTSGNPDNVSEYKTVPIYTGTSSIGSEGRLGTVGTQKLMFKTGQDATLRLYGETNVYNGNVNSLLTDVSYTKSSNGDFLSGHIIVTEWIDGVSTVPETTPVMTFEAYDGTEINNVFMACLDGTNTYYFDRNLTEKMDISKEYIFRISLTEPNNISQYKSMVLTTNEMSVKEGILWETASQVIMYKTVAADGDNQLRVYAVNK